jgi:hypothetical protein
LEFSTGIIVNISTFSLKPIPYRQAKLLAVEIYVRKPHEEEV